MSEEKIKVVLSSIGLNKNEILIYIDLNKNNNSSALEISRRTKIYRSNIYDALRGLIEKGFVNETTKDNKKIFSPVNPEKIKDYIHQKEDEIDSIMPDFKSLSKDLKSDEDVSIIKGVFALRNSFYDLLEIGKPIDAYGISINAVGLAGTGFLDEFHRKRIMKKIPMRHIYNQEAVERMKKLKNMKYTYVKHLAKKYDADAPTNICGDTVVFIVLSDPVSVIKIKSQQIADTYKNYFEILWKKAKSF